MLASVRILPKQKALTAFRPLGDQSCSPVWILHRLTGRLLDLAISALPRCLHANCHSPNEVIARLQDINLTLVGLSAPVCFCASYDFDNCFTNISHDSVLSAWDVIHQLLNKQGQTLAWVNPSNGNLSGPGGKSAYAYWKKPPKGDPPRSAQKMTIIITI